MAIIYISMIYEYDFVIVLKMKFKEVSPTPFGRMKT